MIDRRKMLNSQPKKKLPIIRLVQIGIILFVLFSALHFYENFKNIRLMKQQVIELETRIHLLKLENNRLASVLKQMDSGDYIERVAREELGLVKKGETLIITVEEKRNN